MSSRKSVKIISRHLAKWISISAAIGAACGLASGGFLAMLDAVTGFRDSHGVLLFFLPVGGMLVGALYSRFGKKVDRGNNLIIEEFHDPKSVIPFRMAPMVLIGTLITHLFGGSAGREGTAVQMGGSIADQFTHLFEMNEEERRKILMIGMSGGFGSVFGVPFAGTLFGMEVLAVGHLQLWAIGECAISAFVAHFVTLSVGIHHTSYVHPAVDAFGMKPAIIAIFSGLLFGVAARIFTYLSHQIGAWSKKIAEQLPIRLVLAGAVISLLYFFVPMLQKFAGLGVPEIVESLKTPLPIFDWLGKIVMTAMTVGAGFKGGEVTPLLFVGSTLGNGLSQFLPLSLPLLASMGFVAVFAGCANTPFACTFMAMELFGPAVWPYAAIACFVSFAVSGHKGIYHAQKTSGRTLKKFEFRIRSR